MNLIALTGPAGAGKDTVAEYLATYARFHRMAFADTLRAEVAEAFGIPVQLLEDRAHKERPHPALALRNCDSFCFIGAIALATRATVNSEWLDAPRSPRQILQWWGTEYRRAKDPQYWISALASKAAVQRQNGVSRFVITDCRFKNELDLVRALNGRLWRVNRPELQAVEGQHQSAVDLQDTPADVDLANDGTLDQLRGNTLRHWWATDAGLQPEQLRVEVLA